MTFQSTVRQEQTSILVGEFLESAPKSGFPAILNSGDPANNVLGRGFSHVAGNDDEVQAGGGDTLAFAGILVNPKVYATSGGGSGALSPTLTLQNDEIGEMAEKGMVGVEFTTNANIGDNVFYNDTDGTIAADPAATLAGHTPIPNAVVARFNVTAGTPGYCFLK